MLSAQLLTIGTEITSGEVINSNASWLSLRLEEMGVRIITHLTVRDRKQDILSALNQLNEGKLIFVTGGLGPTSDDITRECMALYTQDKLEFDQDVWADLTKLYAERGLPLREAHRWQCQFPVMSSRLKNPVGTALGFYMEFSGRHYFVMPGPPRELEGMWKADVVMRLPKLLEATSMKWIRWTCLGVPESEAAEVIEPILAGTGLEVGYRAQVPYVKIKVYADPVAHADVIARLDQALSKWLVGRDHDDLAAELLELWPTDSLNVVDEVTDARFLQRLIGQKRDKVTIRYSGVIETVSDKSGAGSGKRETETGREKQAKADCIRISAEGEELVIAVQAGTKSFTERLQLPFKLSLSSERGKRSAAEWALWSVVKNLR